MKVAGIVVRILMGLLFLFASLAYFLHLVPTPPMEGPLDTFNRGLAAATYLLPTVKGVELLCGLAFLAGRFVPLALVVIAPVVVNIALVHVFLDPKGLPIAAFLVLAHAFLTVLHRDRFRPLFKP